jgi:hypothetical protein
LSAGNRFVNEISGRIQAHLEDAPDGQLIVDNENRTSGAGHCMLAGSDIRINPAGTIAALLVL